MPKPEQTYWGTKITVKFGKQGMRNGVLYVKEKEFAHYLRVLFQSHELEVKLEEFHKPVRG